MTTGILPSHRPAQARSILSVELRVRRGCAIGQPHGFGIFGRAFTEPVPARATETHFGRHRRTALRAHNCAALRARTGTAPAALLLRLHGDVLENLPIVRTTNAEVYVGQGGLVACFCRNSDMSEARPSGRACIHGLFLRI